MDELLSMLAAEERVSSERLCEKLSMTRGAVWKRVERLRAQGYSIEGVSGLGYRLESVPNSLLPALISRELCTRWAGRGVIDYAPEMDSTNLRAKELARTGAPAGSLAVCDAQTAGRGRLGRGWQTPRGEALTCSLLLRPRLHPEKAQLFTLAAAVAAARATRELCPGLEPRIKWPNDLVLGGRKYVGILCELSASMDGIDWLVVGVGINVNQTCFAGELDGKATSLVIENGGAPLCRRELLCRFLAAMEDATDALEREGLSGIRDEYVASSATIGSRVRVSGANGEFTGTALGIDDTGALIVSAEDGGERRVLSGDVSVRGIMGYI